MSHYRGLCKKKEKKKKGDGKISINWLGLLGVGVLSLIFFLVNIIGRRGLK